MKLTEYLDSHITDETSVIFGKFGAIESFNLNPNEKVKVLTQKVIKDRKFFSIDTLTVNKRGDILLVESGERRWVP
jgi:hypothetical protein